MNNYCEYMIELIVRSKLNLLDPKPCDPVIIRLKLRGSKIPLKQIPQ